MSVADHLIRDIVKKIYEYGKNNYDSNEEYNYWCTDMKGKGKGKGKNYDNNSWQGKGYNSQSSWQGKGYNSWQNNNERKDNKGCKNGFSCGFNLVGDRGSCKFPHETEKEQKLIDEIISKLQLQAEKLIEDFSD
jgi:hypothetical protein